MVPAIQEKLTEYCGAQQLRQAVNSTSYKTGRTSFLEVLCRSKSRFEYCSIQDLDEQVAFT